MNRKRPPVWLIGLGVLAFAAAVIGAGRLAMTFDEKLSFKSPVRGEESVPSG